MAHIKLEVPYQLNQKNRKQLSWAYNRSRKHIKRFLNLTSSWLVWHTGCLPVQPLKSSLVMLQYLSFYNHRQNLYYQICFILIQPTGYTITKGISNIWFSHSTISSLRGKCGENPKIKNRLTCHNQQIKRFYWYPEPGSNRHGHYWPQDFKSGVSTDSTIRAQSFAERRRQKYENIYDLPKSM